MKKVLSLVLCLVCLMCAYVPGLAEDTQTDFLTRIQGTYVELFPELAKKEYHQAWLDSVTPIVGEDAAEETVACLLSVCMAQTCGPEAAAQYESDPESMRFDCYFIGGVKKMTVEGNVISGVDENEQEAFRHTYAPMVLDNENGFIFYRTEDADAGQFTYFAFSPDTMEDTWHLEFRYAEDTADLMSWFEGNTLTGTWAPSLKTTRRRKFSAPFTCSPPKTWRKKNNCQSLSQKQNPRMRLHTGVYR